MYQQQNQIQIGYKFEKKPDKQKQENKRDKVKKERKKKKYSYILKNKKYSKIINFKNLSNIINKSNIIYKYTNNKQNIHIFNDDNNHNIKKIYFNINKNIKKKYHINKYKNKIISNKISHDKFSTNSGYYKQISNFNYFKFLQTFENLDNLQHICKVNIQQDYHQLFQKNLYLNTFQLHFNHQCQNNYKQKDYSYQIYEYLLKKQLQYIPTPLLNDKTITQTIRSKLVTWLFELGQRFYFKSQTIYVAINVIDRCLGLMKFQRDKLPLLGITSLFIVAKYEEILVPYLGNFVMVVPDMYGVTNQSILQMQSMILDLLQFDLGYTFPQFFIQFSDKVSPMPRQIKTRAIELVKQMIISSGCRYWSASRLALNAIRESEMSYECLTSTSTMIQSSQNDEIQRQKFQ